MQYVGCIDLKGLDSFARADPVEDVMKAWQGNEPHDTTKTILAAMKLRAMYNGQRHPVLFVAELDPEIGELIEQGDRGIEAAVMVLRGATQLAFARGAKSDWEILKKLVPEYQGEYSDEIYPVQTLETIKEST